MALRYDSKVKIAFVLDDSLDVPDGVQQYILMLGREMTRRGLEVHYLVGETVRQDIPNIHSLAKNVKVKFNQNRMRIPLPANGKKIRELLAREKYDALHVQVPFSPMLASKIIMQAPKGTRIIGTFHIAPHSKLVTAGNRVLSWLTRRPLRRFSQMIAVSPVAQAFAKKTFGQDSVVIPNPVEFDEFSKAAKTRTLTAPEDKTIVFLGRLVERKGCAELLRAIRFCESNPDFKNTRVIVAGDGPLRTDLEQTAKSLSTPIEFLGFIDEAEKPLLLASADVAVFPATGGESFGIVLTEAMSAGSGVVLAGDNPGYRSTMADNEEVLFDPHNPEDFSAKLVRALTDSSFASRIHSWQTNHVKQFDVQTVADKIITQYHQ